MTASGTRPRTPSFNSFSLTDDVPAARPLRARKSEGDGNGLCEREVLAVLRERATVRPLESAAAPVEAAQQPPLPPHPTSVELTMTERPTITQKGLNYQVVLSGGFVRASVWRRPDLDWAVGARCAEEIAASMKAMAGRPLGECVAGVLDLREAPPVSGPLTQAALSTIAVAFESRGRRIAFVSGDSAMMQLQLGRILREAAPRHGALFTDAGTAESWSVQIPSAEKFAR